MIETNGPFLRLGKNTWVRASAVVVIRGRPIDHDREGAEVVVRSAGTTSPNAYAVWTEYPVADIIAAIGVCAGREASEG